MGDDVPITSRGVKYTASLKVEIDSRKQMDWPSLWKRRLLQNGFWCSGGQKDTKSWDDVDISELPPRLVTVRVPGV